jgi:GNAT superfamily N-acetyltransferase
MSDENAPVAVRRLREADHEPWLGLWHGYLHFYRERLDDEVTRHSFRRLCDGERSMIGLVAERDDALVGFAHLVFHPSSWSTSDYCYLEDLYVAPAARGSRTGEALFDAVYAIARERGSQHVYWHTQQYNGRARSLYDQVGHATSFVVYEYDLDR